MVDETKDAALIQVLAERMEKHRLPRALSLKEQVDRGETLSDLDVQFLSEVFEDAKHIGASLDRHPEWQPLAAKMIQLYKEITDKALENDQKKGGTNY